MPTVRYFGQLQDITVPAQCAGMQWDITLTLLTPQQEVVLARRIAAMPPTDRTVGALCARLAMSVQAVDGDPVRLGGADAEEEYALRLTWISGDGTEDNPGWPGPLLQAVAKAYEDAEEQPAIIKTEMASDPNSFARPSAPTGVPSTGLTTSVGAPSV